MSTDVMESWPSAELETLGSCPLCANSGRTLIQKDVIDRLFGSAPGKWQVYRCTTCRSSYVDPRPTPASIGRAYTNYFTHADIAGGNDGAARGGVGFRVKSLMNAYRNARWGMQLQPAHSWKWLSWCLTLPLHGLVIANMRHLPRRAPFAGATLLDVGCGSGDFLVMARAAGWHVKGIDFDPKAVEVARAKGIDADVGGLEQVQAIKSQFDYITCSHVIEHVHDPRQWLVAMRNLLKPGGVLWMQTPNIDSRGYQRFGVDWLNLDPPRHLMLFTPETLRGAMRECGLQASFHRLPFAIAIWIYADSLSFSRGRAQMGGGVRWQSLLNLRSVWDALMQSLSVRHGEFITVVATRED
jgi:2-polyprenyl-3-methyl-5-hydroxy-6-metoxy-1,4-benzoquinol methylase